MSPPAKASISLVLLFALLLMSCCAPLGTEALALRERKRRQLSSVASESAAPAAALTAEDPSSSTATAAAATTALPLLQLAPDAAAGGATQSEARPLRRPFARRPLRKTRTGRMRGAQHMANQRPAQLPHAPLPLSESQLQPESQVVPGGPQSKHHLRTHSLTL